MIDQSIIEECRNGNLARFRELVRVTSPFVYSVAFRMLGEEENSRDVVQDTMITIWQKIREIKTAGAYRNWVYRIVMNRCYDMLRKQKNNPEIREDEKTWTLMANTITVGNDNRLDNEEISAIIGLLTSRLSPKQKSVFVLSDIEELSGDEISEITGMSKASVKANLYYARQNISGLLQKYLRDDR